MTVRVREAAPDDRLGIRRVLDAAMLDVREDLPERIAGGDVLVAVEAAGVGGALAGDGEDADDSEDAGDGEDADDSDDPDAPVLGALVLVPRNDSAHAHDGRGARVDAVAVRRARRGQGVGSALVRAAAERHGRLTAEFDPDVRPFYESLGFQIEAVEGGDGRFQGRYQSQSA